MSGEKVMWFLSTRTRGIFKIAQLSWDQAYAWFEKLANPRGDQPDWIKISQYQSDLKG